MPYKNKLVVDANGFPIEGFPLTQGFTALTASADVLGDISGFWCHADGAITITYPDGTTLSLSLSAGDIAPFRSLVSVVVTSGTFSFM